MEPSSDMNRFSPEVLPPSPEAEDDEKRRSSSPEVIVPPKEAGAVSFNRAASAPAASPPMALPTHLQSPPAQPVSPPPALPQTPKIADDVDIIEMEWVDKAKEIDKQHQNDPHAKADAIFHLQREYLKKRYGKDLKPPAEHVD